MTIERKLVRLALICSLLFMAGGGFSFWAIFESNAQWRSYVSHIMARRQLLAEIFIQSGYGNGIHAFKNLVLRRDLKYVTPAVRGFDHALANIDEYLKLDDVSENEQRALTQLRETLDHYRTNISLAVKMVKAGASVVAIDEAVKIDDGPALGRLRELFAELMQRKEQATSTLEKRRAFIISVFSTFFVGTFLFGLFLARRTGGTLVRSISQLMTSSERIARAEWHEPVRVEGDDEMRVLGEYMNRMQAQLRSQFENLRRSNAELERFAFVASHDLQEPLKKIQIYGDFLREELQENLKGDGDLYLNKLQHATVRMGQMIRDVLLYSRLSAKEDFLAEVDLQWLAEELRTDLETLLAQADTRLEIKDLPIVRGNRTQLKQFLQNLLSNAVKFRQPGKPAEIVVQGIVHDGKRVEIVVEDRGIGFDMKFADKVLEPFGRLHPQEAYPGTGIGLAICRRVALNHGSDLSVQSEPGKGTRFSASFELARMNVIAQRVIC